MASIPNVTPHGGHGLAFCRSQPDHGGAGALVGPRLHAVAIDTQHPAGDEAGPSVHAVHPRRSGVQGQAPVHYRRPPLIRRVDPDQACRGSTLRQPRLHRARGCRSAAARTAAPAAAGTSLTPGCRRPARHPRRKAASRRGTASAVRLRRPAAVRGADSSAPHPRDGRAAPARAAVRAGRCPARV
jgi:hypothetical protein